MTGTPRWPGSPLPSRPLVSVVVPSYNQARFVGETLESILSQSYRPLEVLVMDGASTDGTREVLRRFATWREVRVWSEPDAGVVDAVNKGLSRSRGEVAAIQSSDDVYLPGAVEAAVAALRRGPDVGLAYSDVASIDASGRLTGVDRLGEYSLAGLLSRRFYVPQSSAFFRLDLARQLGLWDARVPYVPDLDLWLRIAFRARVEKLAGVLAATRDHTERRDKLSERIHEDYGRMLAQSEELRRAPLALRQAARAGRLLLAARYPHPGDGGLTTRLWRAALAYPPVLVQPGWPRHRLVPGYFRVAGALGSLRRRWRRTSAA